MSARPENFFEIAFQCAICGHLESTYEKLKKHIVVKHHYDERAIWQVVTVGYGCTICEAFKRDWREAREHVRMMHNELVTNCPRHRRAEHGV
jgi:hypothetical protein